MPENWGITYWLKVMVVVGVGAMEYVCMCQESEFKNYLKDSDLSENHWLASYTISAF